MKGKGRQPRIRAVRDIRKGNTAGYGKQQLAEILARVNEPEQGRRGADSGNAAGLKAEPTHNAGESQSRLRWLTQPQPLKKSSMKGRRTGVRRRRSGPAGSDPEDCKKGTVKQKMLCQHVGKIVGTKHKSTPAFELSEIRSSESGSSDHPPKEGHGHEIANEQDPPPVPIGPATAKIIGAATTQHKKDQPGDHTGSQEKIGTEMQCASRRWLHLEVVDQKANKAADPI